MVKDMRRVFRSKKERVLFGVCGGLGEYFDIDPVLVRIVFVILAFVRGTGVVLYMLLALVIPNEPEKRGSKALMITEKAQNLVDELGKKK